MKCPNCFRSHRKLKEVCMAATLLALATDEDDTQDRAKDLLADLDVEMFWDDLSPILDGLNAGRYRLRPNLLDQK